MKLCDYAIANPVKVAVAVILTCLFGLVALARVPVQLTPDVSKPTITVQTQWPGAGPQEIEKEIVEKQEEQLKSVKGTLNFRSECRTGRGEITLEFAAGTDLNARLVDVGNALQQVHDYPVDAEKPRIVSANVNDSAIAFFSLVPDSPRADELETLLARHPHRPELREAVRPAMREDEVDLALLYRLSRERDERGQPRWPELAPLIEYRVDPTLLRNFAEDYLEAEFEKVDGVANANIFGGRKQRLEVVIDPARLAARGISISQLRAKLAAANHNIAAGDVRDGKSRHEVRVVGQFNSLEEVENVVLNETDQTRVRDVADVRIDYAKPESVVRQRGIPSIGVNVQKEDLANVMTVMARVQAKVRELNHGVLRSKGLRLVQTYDQTTYISAATDLVVSNIYSATLLTVLTLLAFLRSWRTTLIVTLSIPISSIGTFLVMWLLGRSINVISLAGLAFAVGIVVDNAIVVLENIYSRYQRGESPRLAASRGASEVWGAVLASTLTTVSVFVPVVFVQEQAGQLFRDLSIAIATSVFLSMVVAVTVIPCAAARLLRRQRKGEAVEASAARLSDRHEHNGHVYDGVALPRRQRATHGGGRFASGAWRWLAAAPRACTEGVVRLTQRLQEGRIGRTAIIVCCVLTLLSALCLVPWDFVPPPAWAKRWVAEGYWVGIPRSPQVWIALAGAALFVPLAFSARRLSIVFTMMLLAVGVSYRVMPGGEYLPDGNRNLVFARLQPPPGYSVEKMMELAEVVENRLRIYWELTPDPRTGQLAEPRIASLFLTARDNFLFMGAAAEDPERARELVPILREAVAGLPDVNTLVQQSSLFEQRMSSGRSIEVEIIGDQTAKLYALGAQLKAEIEALFPADTNTSVRAVPSLVESSPEMRFRRNLAVAAERGLSTADLGDTLNAYVDGAHAGDYYHRGEKVDLVITVPRELSDQVQEIGQLPLAAAGMRVSQPSARSSRSSTDRSAGQTPSTEMIPLAAVTQQTDTTGPDRILRIDRQRAVSLEVKPGESIALEDASRMIDEQVLEPLRHGSALEGGRYKLRLRGTSDELHRMRSALGGSLLLAMLITYLLISALYESFLYPLVIMVSVPMGAVGGFLGLWVLNLFTLHKLDTVTMLGFVILIGTVVNNAILIVDQALVNIRDYGLPLRQAVILSTGSRIRPMMMTTLTTIVGLVPLIVMPGAGSELYRGLSAVVLGGIAVSTVFVLGLIPMLFTLTYEAKQRVLVWLGRAPEDSSADDNEPTTSDVWDPPRRETELAPVLVPVGSSSPQPTPRVRKPK